MGARDDWFRSADWDGEAQELFETKLRRARGPTSKSQYLRIKALYLINTSDPSTIIAGIELLHRFLEAYSDHPHGSLQLPLVHDHLARAYAKLGRPDIAEMYLRDAADSEVATGGRVVTGSDLNLAEFLIAKGDPQSYEHAARLLKAFADRANKMTLQSDRFRYFLAQARIASFTDRPSEASSYATQALKLALDKKPQFPRHPTVGQVQADPRTMRELSKLAESA
jgi:hypothetical protein